MATPSRWYSKLFNPLVGQPLRRSVQNTRGSAEQALAEDGANDAQGSGMSAQHKASASADFGLISRNHADDGRLSHTSSRQCCDDAHSCQIGYTWGEEPDVDSTSDSSRGEICYADCWGRLAGAGQCCRQNLDTRSICELRVRMHVMRLIHET